jgi:hypothetical protein
MPSLKRCGTLSVGGQWQRAEAIYRQLQAKGHTPAANATTALLSGMTSSHQGQRAASLLSELTTGDEIAALSPVYNLVVRALARQGARVCERADLPSPVNLFSAHPSAAVPSCKDAHRRGQRGVPSTV